MKKRAFVRYSKKGKVVPGSLILTGGTFPKGSSTWREVPADLCCDNPIALTWDNNDVSIANISLRLFCDGVVIKQVNSSYSSVNASQLKFYLNGTFGIIGTFTVVGTLVTLTITETQKNALCEGQLSFEVYSNIF